MTAALGKTMMIRCRAPSTLAQRPLFCNLLAHGSLHLERNRVRRDGPAFKHQTLAAVDDLGAIAVQAVPDLNNRDSLELIAAVQGLAASLCHAAHPPQVLAE